jgi:hypothetical protein
MSHLPSRGESNIQIHRGPISLTSGATALFLGLTVVMITLVPKCSTQLFITINRASPVLSLSNILS